MRYPPIPLYARSAPRKRGTSCLLPRVARFAILLCFLAGIVSFPGVVAAAEESGQDTLSQQPAPPSGESGALAPETSDDNADDGVAVEVPEGGADGSSALPPSAREIAGQAASIQAATHPVSEQPEQAAEATPAASGDGAAPPDKPVIPKSIRLFGTVEFRGPLKDIPKWERVFRKEQKTPTFGADFKTNMSPSVAARWQVLEEKIKDQPLMEKARAVNNFFNQWPYKTDMILWGVEDYWETPSEFVRKAGDCEDYAISKYYALRSLGVPANQLRIIALKDTIRNLGHAVLAVYIDGDAYILDNLSNMVLAHKRLTHYAPQFSVNEEFRWAHIKPLNRPGKVPAAGSAATRQGRAKQK